MTIYILFTIDEDLVKYIVGVYSSKKKATAYFKGLNADFYSVEEYYLDAKTRTEI